jgi:hypothetical protein
VGKHKVASNLKWHWDSRFITMLDVELYLAKRLTAASDILASCHLKFIDTKPPSREDAHSVQIMLNELADEADRLELSMTAKLARRVSSQIGLRDHNEIFTRLHEVEDRFTDELENVHLFLVKAGRFNHYENPEPAGSQFRIAFPNANTELKEAGNNFTFDRYKACVFHCCLACESGLAALAKRLKVPKQNNWGRYVSVIRQQLAVRYSRGVKRDRVFYAACAERFDAIRVATRNPASHFGLDSYYTEQEAKDIFDGSCAFLRHLATKLKE